MTKRSSQLFDTVICLVGRRKQSHSDCVEFGKKFWLKLLVVELT